MASACALRPNKNQKQKQSTMTRISKKHGTRSAKNSKLAKGVKGTEMDPEFQDEELQKKLKKVTVLNTVWWYPVYNMSKYMLDPNPEDFVPVRTLSYDVAEGKIFFDFKKLQGFNQCADCSDRSVDLENLAAEEECSFCSHASTSSLRRSRRQKSSSMYRR